MLKFLFELKNRILLLVFNAVFSALLLYNYKEFFFYLLLNVAYSSKFKSANSVYFILTSVTELLNSYIIIEIFFVSAIVFYYSFYHFLLFFNPALYKFEFKVLVIFYNLSLLSLLLSLSLSMNLIIPDVWLFFIHYQNSLSTFLQTKIYFEIKVDEFVFFCIAILMYISLSFQFMLLTFSVYFAKNYSLKFGAHSKKLHHFLCLLFTIFISPLDTILQFLFLFIFIALYESCNVLILIVQKLMR